MDDMEKLLELTAQLQLDLIGDIDKSRTREEHIRMTARANKLTEIMHLMARADLTES